MCRAHDWVVACPAQGPGELDEVPHPQQQSVVG